MPMNLPIDEIICGDAFQVLPSFPEESIDTVMFSPPYWGLRDYKIPKVDDVFAVGGLGLESHPAGYIKRMVVLCRLLRRVLKREGSMFINLGDTYFGSPAGNKTPSGWQNPEKRHNLWENAKATQLHEKVKVNDGKWLQPKQLLLIPSRVAIALQEDGWILRNDIVWHKPNHMPSSVKDRLTNSWEHIFHFVKSKRYFYDLDAIREPHATSGIERSKYAIAKFHMVNGKPSLNTKNTEQRTILKLNPLGKAPEDTITTGREGIAHHSPMDPRPFTPMHVGEHPLGKAPDDTITTGPNSGEYNKEPYKQNNPHVFRLTEEREAGHALGKNPSDTIEVGSDTRPKSKLGVPSRWGIGEQHPENNPRFRHELGKNPDDFWSITTQPYPEAHFATYPEAICVKPIKATCPQWICRKCGKPKTRITKTNYIPRKENPESGRNQPKQIAYVEQCYQNGGSAKGRPSGMRYGEADAIHETVGWSSCTCNATFDSGIVLDPMCGAGTTCKVAFNLGRHYIGIELNPAYVELAKKRLGNQRRLFEPPTPKTISVEK